VNDCNYTPCVSNATYNVDYAITKYVIQNVNAAWRELALLLLPSKLHSSIVILAEIPDELILAAVSLGSVVENNS
jgi:hypothetical protein